MRSLIADPDQQAVHPIDLLQRPNQKPFSPKQPVFRTHIPANYRNRDCQKAVWEREHGDQMQCVDWLLNAICEGLDFPPHARYQFAPDDQLNEIYRSRYPRWKFWEIADSLELETLAMELEKRLGIWDPDLFVLPLREIVRRATGK